VTRTLALAWLVSFSVALLAGPTGPGGLSWTLRRWRAQLGQRSAATSSAQAPLGGRLDQEAAFQQALHPDPWCNRSITQPVVILRLRGRQGRYDPQVGTSQPTRDRILDAAMVLFGQRGYRGTTVGALEQAAGLAPRRGGLYRHFPSKQAVFTAAVSRYASKFRTLEDLLEVLDFDDEPATLSQLAHFALAGLAAEADLFRLLQRDGPDFPDLTMLVHEQLVQRGYDLAVVVFTRLLGARGLPLGDVAALAAIALGSLVHFREDQALYGKTPAGASEDQFVATWVDTWRRVLTSRTAEASGRCRSAGGGSPPSVPTGRTSPHSPTGEQ
jgi:AcrR family transcriptional regulator